MDFPDISKYLKPFENPDNFENLESSKICNISWHQIPQSLPCQKILKVNCVQNAKKTVSSETLDFEEDLMNNSIQAFLSSALKTLKNIEKEFQTRGKHYKI